MSMFSLPDTKLTRIGIFYDGGYHAEVSDYYRYFHPRQARLSIDGLHRFAKHKVAEAERVDVSYCQVVDAHYFRGRFTAAQAQAANRLYGDRQFDEVLMRAGITTHYFPRGPRGEKGIDVWLALEAFELAMYKRFNVLVLISGDEDLVPLVRKLNTLGTRVMILGWDFKYTDQDGVEHQTRTSQALLDEATYPIMMHTLIEDRTLKNDPLIAGLFVERQAARPEIASAPTHEEAENVAAGDRSHGGGVSPTSETDLSAVHSETRKGSVVSLQSQYGFIDDGSGTNKFFHRGGVPEQQFDALKLGDSVEFRLATGPDGRLVAEEVRRTQ